MPAQIGPFKEDPAHPWSAAQQASVQAAYDHCTFPWAYLSDDIYVRFPLNVDGDGWGHTYYGTGTDRHMKVAAHLGDKRRQYTIIHELGHFISHDVLNGSRTAYPVPGTRGQIHDYFNPKRAKAWSDGGTISDNECWPHQVTKLYADATGLTDWDFGFLNDLYPRSFDPADYTAIKAIVSASAGDGDDDQPGDASGAIEYLTQKDQSRRKDKATGNWTACGLHKHLIAGLVNNEGGSGKNYIHDFLIQFDINEWPDAEKINAAYMELVLVSSDPDSLVNVPGSQSALKAQQVTATWAEGDNPSGTWDASDYANPATNTTWVPIGSVGYVDGFYGTVVQFDVTNFVHKWAPTTMKVGSYGVGLNQANRGLLVKATKNDTIDGISEFASSEYATTAWRPRLRFEYTPASAQPVAFTDVPATTIDSNIFNFVGFYSDPLGTDKLGAERIEVRKAGGATVWASDWITAASNERALGAFSIPSSAAPGGIATWIVNQGYEWRAKVRSERSGKVSEWTDWTPFDIDNLAPSINAISLGTLATLDHVYFGGPFSDPDQPAVGVTPPLDFPRISIWWPYWKWTDGQDDKFQTHLDNMLYEKMSGVILMGKDWGGAGTELPSDVEARLDQFIAAGIKPYVGLWMAKFDSDDTTAAHNAWTAGNGKWAGAILDLEDGWLTQMQAGGSTESTTKANATTFFAWLRSHGCDLIGISSYGYPTTFPNIKYDWLNSEDIDLWLPQVYFQATNEDDAEADRIIDKHQNQWDNVSWTDPVKPKVLVGNGYGENANAEHRLYYAQRVLADYGAVSIWRNPIQNSEVRDAYHSLDRNPPTGSVDTILRTRLQLRSEAEGDPAWNDTFGFLWDTGEQALLAAETTEATVARLYAGQALEAGNYTYRVAVMDNNGAWSPWDYGTLTLTVGYDPDPSGLSGYGQRRFKARIVLSDLDANRGPNNVVAVIYDASNIGASMLVNDIGEFYFTVPTTHPQVSEIEPLQRHYSYQFWRNGQWKPLFEGLIVDMDATEDDVVFYGMDYLGLLGKSVETAFFDLGEEDVSIDAGGAKYIDKNVSYIIKDQLARAKAETDSPLGFIDVEAQGSSTLMETIPAKVSINAAFKERLSFIQGLIQSARSGNGFYHRLWVERVADGTHRWRYKTNAGTTRDNLRLRYGELIQGFRIVVLGTGWGSKVYGVGRKAVSANLYFKSASAPGIDTSTWGNIAIPALWDDLSDENDLQRRVNQMAREVGKFGKQVALGLRVNGLQVLDGYELCDSIPIDIQRGAVDTSRYGSGYWTILGVQYRLFPDGHDELTLAVKPREDTTPPDEDLIPSLPVSSAHEWYRLGYIGTNLTASTQAALRNDGTTTASVTATWDGITDPALGFYVTQLAQTSTQDFGEAITVQSESADITFYDLLPGMDYSVRVGAFDLDGRFSGWSTPYDITAADDTTAPNTPENLAVGEGVLSLLVAWTGVSAADLAYYEVGYKVNTDPAYTVVKVNATAVVLTNLTGDTAYDVRVRAVDLTGNASAWSSVVNGTPRLVSSGDVGGGQINSFHISELSADLILSGTLIVGGTSGPEFSVVNTDGTEIAHIDANGMLFTDPANPNRLMRWLDGTLEFSDDAGANWDTAINADGITATAIKVGVFQTGNNLIPNASFEQVAFYAVSEHTWTSLTDWGTTIGTDVNVDKSTGDLKLSSVTY